MYCFYYFIILACIYSFNLRMTNVKILNDAQPI